MDVHVMLSTDCQCCLGEESHTVKYDLNDRFFHGKIGLKGAADIFFYLVSRPLDICSSLKVTGSISANTRPEKVKFYNIQRGFLDS